MAIEATQLMKGKRGLVMGVANDHSIAWGIARTLAFHGATLAFTYQGDAQGKRVRPLAESVGSKLVLPCDVGSDDDLAAVFAALPVITAFHPELTGDRRIHELFVEMVRDQA